MKTVKRYKFLRAGFKSENGNQKWKFGQWVKVDGRLDMCYRGLHACKNPYQAFSFVQGEILALVECRGEHLTEQDKECWREQRVIKAWKWMKKDSVALAIYSAELVLKNFEKEFPNDLRPREAIEAAKKVLFKDTAKNRSAAWSAAESAAWSARSAAWSAAESAAWSARSAARSAAWSARSAAGSARSAAGSAARSARLAAESAARSARLAAESALVKKIIKFFDQQVEKLDEIKEE